MTKIERILKSHDFGDLANLHIGAPEQALGVGEAQCVTILDGTAPRPIAKATVKVGHAYTVHLCIFLYFFILVPFLAKCLCTTADGILIIVVLQMQCADEIQKRKDLALGSGQIAFFTVKDLTQLF